MSLLQIDLLDDVSCGIDADYARDSARSYHAFFDVGDDEFYVQSHCGISIGSAHPTDAYQRVLGIRCTLVAARTTQGANTDARLWKIDVSYGYWNILERSPDGNPLHIPTRFRLDFTSNNVPAYTDVDGNPIVNSAGDYYDPPVEFERLHATLTVMRNEGSVNPALLAALSNTVNVAAWNGFPPKTVRITPIKIPVIAYSQNTNAFYWPMEYQFEINFDTWVKLVLNQGFRQLDGSGNLVPIFLNGQPAESPVMLDQSGHAIITGVYVYSGGNTPGDTASGGTSSDPAGGGEPPSGGTGTEASAGVVVNAFDVYRTLDFTFLNMDSLFTLPSL